MTFDRHFRARRCQIWWFSAPPQKSPFEVSCSFHSLINLLHCNSWYTLKAPRVKFVLRIESTSSHEARAFLNPASEISSYHKHEISIWSKPIQGITMPPLLTPHALSKLVPDEAPSKIQIKNLQTTLPLTDAWGCPATQQPVLISASISLRHPFSSASNTDTVTKGTGMYWFS